MLKLNPKKSTPLLFAVVTVVYGLLLPFTGFYWDDWAFCMDRKFSKWQNSTRLAPFRPFLGPIFYFTTSRPTRADLLANLCSGHSPHHRTQRMVDVQTRSACQPRIGLIAALLIRFPGYSQHWVALTHINRNRSCLFLSAFIWFTFKALRAKTSSYAVIALLLQLCGIFPTEYFFGLKACFPLSFSFFKET